MTTRPVTESRAPAPAPAEPKRSLAPDRVRFAAILHSAHLRAQPERFTSGKSRTAHAPAPPPHDRVITDPALARRDGRAGDRDEQSRDDAKREAILEAFAPPPAILGPTAPSLEVAPKAGSALAHAEAAALADRLVTSMQVGRIGRDRHEVRMRLSVAGGNDLSVALEARAGIISAVLTAAPGGREEADRVASSLRDALAARGIDVGQIVVEV